jgi:hypothetical protein
MTLCNIIWLITVAACAIILKLVQMNNKICFTIACILSIIPVVGWAILFILIFGGPIYI